MYENLGEDNIWIEGRGRFVQRKISSNTKAEIQGAIDRPYLPVQRTRPRRIRHKVTLRTSNGKWWRWSHPSARRPLVSRARNTLAKRTAHCLLWRQRRPANNYRRGLWRWNSNEWCTPQGWSRSSGKRRHWRENWRQTRERQTGWGRPRWEERGRDLCCWQCNL